MKLTKAQRLFIKAGKAQADEKLYKWYHESDLDYSKEISKAKRKRKRLIREALEVYETEKLVQQASAYARGFCDGRRIKSHNTLKTMPEYLQIKIDRNAYNVALAILHKEFALMRNLTYTHVQCAQLERAIGAFYAAPLINETTKTQHT